MAGPFDHVPASMAGITAARLEQLGRITAAIDVRPDMLLTDDEGAALARALNLTDPPADVFDPACDAVRSWASRAMAVLEPRDRQAFLDDVTAFDNLDPDLVRIAYTQALRR